MAYFNQEMKKEKAPEIKKILKKYEIKGSLAVRHHSTVCLNLKSGKIDFFKDTNNYQVNVFHISNQFTGKAKKFLEECYEVLMKGNFDKSDYMTDYFHVGWYVDINIGKWDKPYIFEK